MTSTSGVTLMSVKPPPPRRPPPPTLMPMESLLDPSAAPAIGQYWTVALFP